MLINMSYNNIDKWKLNKKDQEVKEEFCGACLAIPIALVGIGASRYESNSRIEYKKQKKWIFYGGVIVITISILIIIYYIWIKKCSTCIS